MSDKTEDPTPKRLAKAREKGDVAMSAVASQAIAFLVAVLVAPAAIAAMATESTRELKAAMAIPTEAFTTQAGREPRSRLILPLLLAVGATAALVTVVQTGGLFAPARVSPDFSKLDPIAGLRSLVSGQRLWNVARALVSALAVGFLTWRALVRYAPDLAHAVGNAPAAMAVAARATRGVARDAALIGIAFALVDWWVTRAGAPVEAQDDQERSEARAPRERR